MSDVSVPAVQAIGLSKTFLASDGEVPAVRGIDLAIPDGEFFGLLGPNGAGKSTTIGMLTTLIVPTSGSASVLGIDVVHHPVEVKRRIGMVSQNNTLDQDLTVAENLEFRSRYFGMSSRGARDRARELLDLFGVADKQRAMPRELSGGQARRLMICRALAHRPQVLFLDEPTVGLDAQTRVNLWDSLRQLQADGQTILLTTHYMEEAEQLCDRVAIIDDGVVLACDTVEALKRSSGADTVITVAFDGTPPDSVADLAGRPTVRQMDVTDGRLRVITQSDVRLLGELIALGTSAGVPVVEATRMPPSLETVYLTLTGREYRE
ncbi:MAG: ABC transporter ATP-binding protein [Acidimicrobiia bacterium]|nr:ABC transporter ATP-binding protein [Acidimicrobiia bacterium]